MESADSTHSKTSTTANILAWVGVFLFLTGGLTLRTVINGHPVLMEISQWGLAFIPLGFLVLFSKSNWRDLSLVRRLHRLWPHFGERPYAIALVWTIGVLHFFAMMARHLSFNSEWDISIYANACANHLQSSLRNHTSLLADHFEPALGLLTPLCSQFNPVPVLLATQCLAWLAGAWAIRKIALHLKWSDSLATVAMTLYLLFAGNQTVSYYDFHLYSLSLGTVPWLWLGLLQRRYLLVLFVLGLHLALKEHTALFVAGLGLFMTITRRRDRVTGMLLVLFGLVSFFVVMKIVFPHFRGGTDSEYFAKYYGHLGSTFAEFLRTSYTKPWIPIASLLEPAKFGYYATILAPFAFIHLLRPWYLLPIAGPVAIAALSTAPFMYSANFHYEAEVYAWLFCSAVVLAQDSKVLSRWQKLSQRFKFPAPLQPLTLWLFVMIGLFSGVTPQGRLQYYAPSRPQMELEAELQRLTRSLAHCKVATVERISSHLAAIPELTMLNEHNSADAIVVAYPQGARLWIQDFATIEDQYVPQWNRNYTVHNPLKYDRDFRVWLKPSCLADLK